MPNWCDNRLIITADDEARLSAILDAIRPAADDSAPADPDNEVISFQRVIPIGDDDIATFASLWDRDGTITARTSLWGTKWEPGWAALAEDGSALSPSITIDFSTAWSPPIPVIDALAKRFPEVRCILMWAEPGVDAAGVLTWSAGVRESEIDLDGSTAAQVLSGMGWDVWPSWDEDE